MNRMHYVYREKVLRAVVTKINYTPLVLHFGAKYRSSRSAPALDAYTLTVI